VSVVQSIMAMDSNEESTVAFVTRASEQRTVLGQVAAAQVVALLLQHQRQRVPAEDEPACAPHTTTSACKWL